jgi:RHS repeat-associated protein
MEAKQQKEAQQSRATGKESFAATTPTITLPKGGGAIRGMGEKFAANPVTGTGSLSVPIATSPGRSGFSPQLSLSYDSGSGNGPFGFGWSLSLRQITRRTDKGLPQYRDAEESDVFILSGAEDLVPVFKKKPNGEWELDADGRRVIDEGPRDGYVVRRYRPRIEGLFARIERWTNTSDHSDVHWRSVSKDNVLTLYGKDSDSRIFDPGDPAHIFSWLICESRDDKGNAVLYAYKPEDGTGVDLTQTHQSNRGDRDDSRRKTSRYLKHIRYGNRLPLLDDAGHRPRWLAVEQTEKARWMFEVVFDYGDHDRAVPKPGDYKEADAAETLKWPWFYRQDPFSTYRAGFEVRTTRLCQRVLMFHHFESEEGVGSDCLVRSTDLIYSDESNSEDSPRPLYTFLRGVTQTGYRRDKGGYTRRSLPPVEFEYSRPDVQEAVEEVDRASLENLPIGLDGSAYQWIDLHGEGVPGILTEQPRAWLYKRNLSPASERAVEFGPLECAATKPNLTLAGGQAQFMDLAGDGQPDLVVLDGPAPGLYEHDGAESWQPFRPFISRLNRDTRDPHVRFVDLDGDGHADALITEDNAFTWHASVAEDGFGPAQVVHQAPDEEKGPRLVFGDGTQSIYLADMSGDGLTDLVRIRNGEVCYWPNLGYGRFGARVTMDRAPHFDHPDQFDHKRVRLADIDGTGTTDIIYLHRDGVRLYFNQSGNSWSTPHILSGFPKIDDVVSIVPVDLKGNGTACLVWSSPLPGDAPRPMRYVNLMGGQKPHLLIKTINNLGAETRVQYAPSTKFYLKDRNEGKAWITKLPFPVHVVERVETYDHVGKNRFVARYEYHHGYFDGVEREFRGFGMVEQRDTEEFAALSAGDQFPVTTNTNECAHVPPVLTKTWFHTGVCLGRDHVSDFFAGRVEGDRGEYYREPARLENSVEARKRLLDDTVVLDGLTVEEEREACRALKGSMLRQEVYSLDGPGTDGYPHGHPYTVIEQNFAVQLVQPKGDNRHAVFFTHPNEAITYHYERRPDDPRTQHALTLEVDFFGNVLKEAAIGYGRRQPDLSLPAAVARDEQTKTLVTYTENCVTNSIDSGYAEDYRAPAPCETRIYQLTGYTPTGAAGRFRHGDFVGPDSEGPKRLIHIFDKEISYEELPTSGRQRRSIEQLRTLYRRNDLRDLLGLCELESLALPGESYKLAFTPGLLVAVYQRPHEGLPSENLLPDASAVLGSRGPDAGGYVDLDGDGRWWVPSGLIFLSPRTADTPPEELAYASQHFFLPLRYRDPFHTKDASTESFVRYDDYDLLIAETRDAAKNLVSVKTRDDAGNAAVRLDYRVLQPYWVTDPNGNRSRAAFDALGMVVGTAIMGKPPSAPVEGDSLEGFETDLAEAVILGHLANPLFDPQAILYRASTRLVYDLFAYQRTKDQPDPQPVVVYTLARETHDSDLRPAAGLKIQHGFSYSDGFGREIQKKIQAEPGPAPLRDDAGRVATGANRQPIATDYEVDPRWVGSGWTIFNNKGKPVRQYEPFFSDTHRFDRDARIGVSPVVFYDPVGRVVATLDPNHTYEKVGFDPWQQTTWDVNDTVLVADPKTDPDVGDFFARLPDEDYLPTWHEARNNGQKGPEEKAAAARAAVHSGTPMVAFFDTLGRPFLTVAHNRFERDDAIVEERYPTRIELDIEGNQREVIDAKDRSVMRYGYDMLGNRIRQASMEAGERWMLNDVAGKPIRVWDSRNHNFRTEYDRLRRPVRQWVGGIDADEHGPGPRNREIQFARTEYGEDQPGDTALNLRTRVFRQFDSAGVVTNKGRSLVTKKEEAYDFKGNLLRNTRQLAKDYKSTPDWSARLRPTIEGEIFTTSTTYDALNRPIQLIAPHSDRAGTRLNVIQPLYNEANLLEGVTAWLKVLEEPDGLLEPDRGSPHGVKNIDYDAKGQRTLIQYGNGVRTRYRYDLETFRLINLHTTRGSAYPDDCPDPPNPPCGVQNLYYTYDPAGNITRIRDDAQQTVYFNGAVVKPHSDYRYDAIYRLIEATGREHLGQAGGSPTVHSYNDAPRVGVPHPGDGNAMGRYVERYVYDAVGNLETMQHRGSDPAHAGWTRTYAYNETSQLERHQQSNRLSSTTVGNNNPPPERYGHDAHGNTIRMPHLGGEHPEPNLHWDYRDQLRQADLGGGGTAYYVYDAGGQRVRKVWEKAPGLTEERIYFGGFEVFRRHNGLREVTLERESLHIMAGKQRIALVETRTVETARKDSAPPQLVRYQFGNHLGSASLELDDQARIISYEEYVPYGSTSYQAVRSQTETPKRYRCTGKERDEESGFHYHGARYYAAWLGIWTSCDPQGLVDGVNLFRYVANNPLAMADPTGTDAQVVVDAQGRPVPALSDVLLTTDPQMAERINEITSGALEQAWDPESGARLPVGAYGGVMWLTPEASIEVPSLAETLGIKGTLESGGLTLQNDLDILGGYTTHTLYRRYFIQPERQYVTTVGGSEIAVKDPARIHDLGRALIANPLALFGLASDLATIVPAAKSLIALRGTSSAARMNLAIGELESEAVTIYKAGSAGKVKGRIGGYVTTDPITELSAAEVKEVLDLNVGELAGKYLGPIEIAEATTTFENLKIPYTKWDALNIEKYASVGYTRGAGYTASPGPRFAAEFELQSRVPVSKITIKHYKRP